MHWRRASALRYDKRRNVAMSSYDIDLIQKLISKNRRNIRVYSNDILLLNLIQNLKDLNIEVILII